MRDPAGILSRIPELEPLCADPGVRRAVEKGDPLRVYRAIWWARRTGRLVAHRRTVDLLLAHRRAFAVPLEGSPTLGTFNGFGATFLGSDEGQPDGTRIATHCAVALFVLPLFPFGAYLVSRGERKLLSTTWNVLARVPLGTAAWLYRRAVAVAVAAAVVWGGAAWIWSARHRDVYVVNGLLVPVQAELGGQRRRVPPGGVATVSAPVGTLQARAALEGGATLESFALPVEARELGGRAVLVWNVAGAAPVYEETVQYTAETPGPPQEPPKPVLHCGDRVFQASADDLFRPPPSRISMPKGASVSTRRHLDIAVGDTPGAELCATNLLDARRDAEALRVLAARAQSRGWKREDVGLVLRLASAAGAGGEQAARAVRAALPDDVLVHRGYQDVLEAAGKLPELVAEYRGRAEAAPQSATAQYLHVRLLDGDEQRAAAEAALARFPADPNLLRLAAALRASAGDLAGTLTAYRALRAISAEQAAEVLHEATASLLRLGRGGEALDEIAALFEKLPPPYRGEPAALFARVAAREGARTPDELVRRVEEGGPNPVLRLRAGLPSSAARKEERGPEPDVAELYALLVKDPNAALERAGAFPPALLGTSLDTGAWALLFCEAARAKAGIEPTLVAFAHVRPRHVEALRRYVRAEGAAPLPPLPLEVRSAAEFVRSRNASLPADERTALARAARSDDPLASYVAEAMARWPRAR